MKTEADITPFGHYRRQIPGADFSLEANTPRAPKKGEFYLLKSGRVLLSTQDFGEAVEAYQEQCREYWEDHLSSEDPEKRLSSAWGLVGLNPEDKTAGQVIRDEGDPKAVKRLEDIRRRKRAERWAAARRRAKS